MLLHLPVLLLWLICFANVSWVGSHASFNYAIKPVQACYSKMLWSALKCKIVFVILFRKRMPIIRKLMKDRNIFSDRFAAYILQDELHSFLTFGMHLYIRLKQLWNCSSFRQWMLKISAKVLVMHDNIIIKIAAEIQCLLPHVFIYNQN